MPNPALSAAARLTALTNPVGSSRPASVTSPSARPAARPAAGQTAFPSVLAEQLGLSGLTSGDAGISGSGAQDPLSALMGGSNGSSPFASPQIAQALANAQKAVTSTASAISSAVSSKGQKAVAWAKSMIGRQDWNNLCERFVEEAYGTKGAFPDAKDAARQLVTHKGSSSLRTAPPGALLYFTADQTNEGHGHAGIYLGNGEMISARPDGVKVERVDTPYNRERFLGWGPAPTKFPGRRTTAAASSPVRQAASAAQSLIPAARSAPTSGSVPSTPRPGPAPLIPPRLPR